MKLQVRPRVWPFLSVNRHYTDKLFSCLPPCAAKLCKGAQLSLSVLTKCGRIECICYGVYRVSQVSPSIYDRFMLALLWTDADEAALSHETALAAYDVCDINSIAIDITVGRARRIRRSGGEGHRLHCQDLDRTQVGWWEGMRCVKLATAIDQCIKSGVDSYLLERALDNGRKKGFVTVGEAKELSLKLKKRDEDG